mgnify:CR=1 FL=1
MRLNKSQKKWLLYAVIAIAMAISGKFAAKNAPSFQPMYRERTVTGTLVNAPDGFELPQYAGLPATELNGGVPYSGFPNATKCYEDYPELDSLGRCGSTSALLGPETLPTEERGRIGSIKPSGWHTVKYNDLIDGNYLYNRCHLIAFSLSGENANERNLVTGTRYMNVEGMLPYEMQVLDHIKETGDKVFYKASPIFINDELVPRGVLLEAMPLDQSFSVCVFLHNVQPGIEIDYATGESQRADP